MSSWHAGIHISRAGHASPAEIQAEQQPGPLSSPGYPGRGCSLKTGALLQFSDVQEAIFMVFAYVAQNGCFSTSL